MIAKRHNGALLLRDVSREDMERLGMALAGVLMDGDVILLEGELGTGKTTLSQALARALGVDSPVVSPTFSIVCTYDEGHLPLNHFDLYRLETEDELDDVDFWSLVDESTPGASLIEWADLFADAMPHDALTVHLDYGSVPDGPRMVSLKANGERAAHLLEDVATQLIPLEAS